MIVALLDEKNNVKKYYASCQRAAKDNYVADSTVSSIATGKRKPCYGLNFKYLSETDVETLLNRTINKRFKLKV